jgi:hypothetical protein
MGQRLQLQEILKTLTPEVYFQAPSKDKMEYPCIVYNIDGEDAKYADNNPYSLTLRYQVTVIDRTPDTPIRGKVANLPGSRFNRFFVADGLNHYVYNLHY